MAASPRPDAPDRGRLTPARVVERAVQLADSEGLATVSIRRLARELGVTPMALYWHFENKEALLAAIADCVFAELDPTVDVTAPWYEQFRALLRATVTVTRAHPAAAPLLTSCTLRSEPLLRTIEVALDILGRGGFSPEEAVRIARYALRTILVLVDEGSGAFRRLDPDEVQGAARQTRIFLETLPPDRFPRLVEAAIPLSTCDDPDVSCELGIDALVSGLQSLAARGCRQTPAGELARNPTVQKP